MTDETISVPEAGRRFYGLSRDGSYRAAKTGLIPVIPVGRLLRVPVRAMQEKLAQESAKAAAVADERQAASG